MKHYRDNEDAAIKVMRLLSDTRRLNTGPVIVDSANLELLEAFAECALHDEEFQQEYPNLHQLFAVALTARLEEKDIEDYDNDVPDQEIYERLKAKAISEMNREVRDFDIKEEILKRPTACWILFEIQNLKAMFHDPDAVGTERVGKDGNVYQHTLMDTIDNLYSILFDILDIEFTEDESYRVYDYIDTQLKISLEGLKFKLEEV